MAFPPYLPGNTADENGTEYVMTSRSEVERVLSQRGMQLHLDDIDPDDDNFDDNNDPDTDIDNYLEEQIVLVTAEIMAILGPRYLIEDVYQNIILRNIATYRVAHNITRRRGNEPVFESEVIEGEDKLTAMQLGQMYLDAPSNGQRAIMQSGIVDLRFHQQPYRVIQRASTSVVSGQNHIWRAFSWL